jgi:elongator complex protein 3
LVGFCRFRIDPNSGANIIPELKNCALIREVHVYGHSLGVGDDLYNVKSTQHKGYGQLLVKTAEEIAIQNNCNKIAIIAGVGTREYYKNKCNYVLEGTYMTKNLTLENKKYQLCKYNIKLLSVYILYPYYLILFFLVCCHLFTKISK